ncbi:hypothetical protein BKA64DRAFT_188445 [Cadophora sp. MPI-SDFR-AT-0126]|nr:hypothetical protein BKA64DRAFT_188445 [Leotiomycetes sp. MPI-SDFR-AT-0126]
MNRVMSAIASILLISYLVLVLQGYWYFKKPAHNSQLSLGNPNVSEACKEDNDSDASGARWLGMIHLQGSAAHTQDILVVLERIKVQMDMEMEMQSGMCDDVAAILFCQPSPYTYHGGADEGKGKGSTRMLRIGLALGVELALAVVA